MPTGATIRLWRLRHSFWDLLPFNPRFAVVLDGTEVADLWPRQIKVFPVSPGEHRLRLNFYWFLRRSEEFEVTLRQGEEAQFACFINAVGYAYARPATSKDIAKMERWKPTSVTPHNLAEG